MAKNPNWESDWKAAKARLDSQKLNFADVLDAFAKELVPEGSVLLTRRVAFDVFNDCCEKTPVDTGNARANWNIAKGVQADLSVTDDTERNKTEADRAREADAAMVGLCFGEAVTVSNNVEYADVLERGWSDQAPHGMLGRTLDEVRVSIERSNRERE